MFLLRNKKNDFLVRTLIWRPGKVNPQTVITFNNCMRSTDNLNLVPKHIMTSLSESPCLIIPYLSPIFLPQYFFLVFLLNSVYLCRLLITYAKSFDPD